MKKKTKWKCFLNLLLSVSRRCIYTLYCHDTTVLNHIFLEYIHVVVYFYAISKKIFVSTDSFFFAHNITSKQTRNRNTSTKNIIKPSLWQQVIYCTSDRNVYRRHLGFVVFEYGPSSRMQNHQVVVESGIPILFYNSYS